jgi:hypothetical protein
VLSLRRGQRAEALDRVVGLRAFAGVREHGGFDRLGAAVVQERREEPQPDQRRGAPLAPARVAFDHAVGERAAHVVQQEVGVDGRVDRGERRDRVVAPRRQARHVARRARRALERRAAFALVRVARRDLEQPHVVGDARDDLVRHVDAGLGVVAHGVGVRRLARMARARQPHVAAERVGGELVERGDARLQAEAADARARGVARVGDAVDTAADRPRAPRRQRREPLDRRVVDGLEVAAAEHRRRQALVHAQARVAVRRADRGARAGRHVRALGRAERQQRAQIDACASGLRRKDADLAHAARPARVAAVARHARRAHVQRPEAVGVAERRLEQVVTAREALELGRARARERQVGAIDARRGVRLAERARRRSRARAARHHREQRARDPAWDESRHDPANAYTRRLLRAARRKATAV